MNWFEFEMGLSVCHFNNGISLGFERKSVFIFSQLIVVLPCEGSGKQESSNQTDKHAHFTTYMYTLQVLSRTYKE